MDLNYDIIYDMVDEYNVYVYDDTDDIHITSYESFPRDNSPWMIRVIYWTKPGEIKTLDIEIKDYRDRLLKLILK